MAVGILSKGHQDVVGMQDEHVLLGQKGQKAISRSQIAALQATLLVVCSVWPKPRSNFDIGTETFSAETVFAKTSFFSIFFNFSHVFPLF